LEWFFAGMRKPNTRKYLLSPQSRYLIKRMRGIYPNETEELKLRLQSAAAVSSALPRLRVALSNHELINRGGSELWIADIAKFLVRSGSEVIVYSPALGPVAKHIKDTTGAAVTSSVDAVRNFSPDILHVQ